MALINRTVKTHQNTPVTGRFSPNLGVIHIQLQCPNRAEQWSLSSSLEAKGGGRKEWSVTTWARKRCGQDLGNIARLRPQGHLCKSSKLSLVIVSASKRATLRVSIHSELTPRARKGAVTRPSRTTDKSQEGTAVGRAGLSHLTPRIQARLTDASQGESHPALSELRLRWPLRKTLRVVAAAPAVILSAKNSSNWTNRAVDCVYCSS